jgi:hypothetical protein
MKIVHTTQNEIARIVTEFQNEVRRNNLSRETCVVTAVKKGSNETTVQTHSETGDSDA